VLVDPETGRDTEDRQLFIDALDDWYKGAPLSPGFVGQIGERLKHRVAVTRGKV
jgi:hypothetical protein